MSAAVVLLVIAFVLTYIGALVFWLHEFGDDDLGDVFIGALWSFIVAAIFPLVWVAVVVVCLVIGIRRLAANGDTARPR